MIDVNMSSFSVDWGTCDLRLRRDREQVCRINEFPENLGGTEHLAQLRSLGNSPKDAFETYLV